MNFTRALTLFQGGNFKEELRRKVERKKDDALLALLKRVLDNPHALRLIADTFDGSTPMCHVLDRAIDDKVEEVMRNNQKTDADDIDGLDRHIENVISESLIEAESIKGLDRAIEQYLEENSNELASSVVDLMAERLRK